MKTLTLEQIKRLERLAQRPTSEINLSDMPETTNWEDAVRGPRPTHPRAELTAEQREQLERTHQEEVRLGILPDSSAR